MLGVCPAPDRALQRLFPVQPPFPAQANDPPQPDPGPASPLCPCLPDALPAAIRRSLVSGPSGSIPGAALRKERPSAGWPAGENAVGAGQPPVLAAAEPLGTKHLLGRAQPRTDPAESRKKLCGPVHIECLCNFPGRRDRQNPALPIALRRIRGYNAAVPPIAALDAWAPHPAPYLGTASLYKLRMRDGAVSDAGCANASVCRTGVDGYFRMLAKNRIP